MRWRQNVADFSSFFHKTKSEAINEFIDSQKYNVVNKKSLLCALIRGTVPFRKLELLKQHWGKKEEKEEKNL